RIRRRAQRRPHEDVRCSEPFLLEAERFADAALDSIAIRRFRSMLSRNEQAQARRARITSSQVEGKSAERAPGALAQQPLKVGLAPQPAPGIQSVALDVRDYSPSRRRPFARRFASTLRPPGVLLRTRKPCV